MVVETSGEDGREDSSSCSGRIEDYICILGHSYIKSNCANNKTIRVRFKEKFYYSHRITIIRD